MCEPCGACWFCHQGQDARELLRPAIDLRDIVYTRIFSAGPDEVRGNPTLGHDARALDAFDAYLATLDR